MVIQTIKDSKKNKSKLARSYEFTDHVDKGSGTVFTFPDAGTNVVILVKCCPITFPMPGFS